MSLLNQVCMILESAGGAKHCLATVNQMVEAAGAQVVSVRYVSRGKEESTHLDSISILSDNPLKNHFFNGVVISGLGKVLAHPPKRLTPITLDELHKKYADGAMYGYECIEAANATMVTLYYGSSRWMLATSRSSDVGSFVLLGTMSFMDIFMRLLEIKQLTLDDFDPRASYTFVMAHPSYHILYNMDLFLVKTTATGPLSPTLEAMKQPHVLFTPEQIATNLAQSLAKVETCVAHNCPVRGAFGYIYRTDNPSAPDYYIESDVMTFLRTYIYSTFREKYASAMERQLFALLKICLVSETDNRMYRAIFRNQYGDAITAIKTLLNYIKSFYQVYYDTQGGRIETLKIEVYYDLFASAKSRGIKPDALLSLSNVNEIWPILRQAAV